MSCEVERLKHVLLKVYLQADLAEVVRVLRLLVLQPMVVERFNANLAHVDVRGVKGLDAVSSPVIRMAVVGSVTGDRDVERVTKALNRLVSVYKVTVEAAS